MALKAGKSYSTTTITTAAKTAPVVQPAPAPVKSVPVADPVADPIKTADPVIAPQPVSAEPMSTLPVATTSPVIAPTISTDDTNSGSDGSLPPIKLPPIKITPADSTDDTPPNPAPNDPLVGTDGNDTINGGDDNDEIIGLGGNDLLNGNDGNDTIHGGSGNDTLNGGRGVDKLHGDTGNDLLNGGTGDDILHGGSGNDTLNGEDGNDVLYGNDGDDVIDGGRHNDTIYGDDTDGETKLPPQLGPIKSVDVTAFNVSGDKVNLGFTVNGNMVLFDAGVNGGRHADELDFELGKGSEKIRVDFGAQNVTAALVEVGNFYIDPHNHAEIGQWKALDAQGNVVAAGSFTADDVFGVGDGNFQFAINVGSPFRSLVFSALDDGNRSDPDNSDYTLKKITYTTASIGDNSFNDTLNGGTGDDQIFGMRGHDSINGGDGNDTLLGGSGKDTIDGSRNNDWIEGGDGDDSLLGGSGNDTIFGGAGMDTMRGGDGNDHLHGDADMDEMSGGNGDDEMWGWGGDDWMFGGAGKDWMHGADGNDIVHGEGNNDMIFGEDGNDILEGGTDDGSIKLLEFSHTYCPDSAVIVTDPATGIRTVHFSQHGENFVAPLDEYGNPDLSGIPFFQQSWTQLQITAGDNLTGGAGVDTFVYTAGDGVDIIHDFNMAEGDRIQLHGALNPLFQFQDGNTIILFGDPGENNGGLHTVGAIVLEGVILTSDAPIFV